MIDADLTEFNQVFEDVRRVFPLRSDELETRQLVTAYFAALRRFPLSRVRDGAESCIAFGKRFPRPVEWRDAIPEPGAGAQLPELTVLEASDYAAAERRGFEGEPCGCLACREAGVEHRFTRFVPDEDRDGQIVKARIGDRVVTRGHWAHGFELHRWYLARDRFWETCRTLGVKLDDPALGQPRTLRCMCCKVLYRRGEFRCCAPPKGMASHVWLGLTCPMPDQGGCGKCARHCQCPSKADRVGTGPLAILAADVLQDLER